LSDLQGKAAPHSLGRTEKNVLVLGWWSKELTSPHPSVISEVLVRNFMRLLDQNRLYFSLIVQIVRFSLVCLPQSACKICIQLTWFFSVSLMK
jgi:hypothetical protein